MINAQIDLPCVNRQLFSKQLLIGNIHRNDQLRFEIQHLLFGKIRKFRRNRVRTKHGGLLAQLIERLLQTESGTKGIPVRIMVGQDQDALRIQKAFGRLLDGNVH